MVFSTSFIIEISSAIYDLFVLSAVLTHKQPQIPSGSPHSSLLEADKLVEIGCSHELDNSSPTTSLGRGDLRIPSVDGEMHELAE